MKQYTERIKRWREAFSDETTGIHATIQGMLWNYAVFQTTVKIVQLSGERQAEGVVLNQMLFDLIREGYWSSLLLGTRRLLDNAVLKGPKGVYSIRSVVADVKNSQTWLDRKMYVEKIHGAEYNTEGLKQARNQLLAKGNGPIWGNREIIKSDLAHRYFDELSGVSPSERSKDDLIDPEIFTRIEARLAVLDKISEHATTHVAHSGNKESRDIKKPLKDFGIQEAQITLKQLKEISTLVGVWFANEGSGDLPVYIGDKFKGLEYPILFDVEMEKVEEHWDTIEQEIGTWSISGSAL